MKPIRRESDQPRAMPSARAEREAADWRARHNGAMTATEREAFMDWLGSDPEHARAWAAIDDTWRVLAAARQDGTAAAVQARLLRAGRPRRPSRRAWYAGVGLAAAALVGIVQPWSRREVPAEPPPAIEIAARPTIRTLSDGSKIALRPGADVAIDYSPGSRRVRLERGEALFSVAHDPTRPFIVVSRNVEVRAVGTEFSVRETNAAVTVVVTEGRVAVGASTPAPPVYATAGQQVQVSLGAPTAAPGSVAQLAPAELAQALAWRGERIEFSDTPLADAIREFNSRQETQIILADPALGRRSITGVLWADDGDGLVRLLESGFDLRAERADNVVRLYPTR